MLARGSISALSLSYSGLSFSVLGLSFVGFSLVHLRVLSETRFVGITPVVSDVVWTVLCRSGLISPFSLGGEGRVLPGGVVGPGVGKGVVYLIKSGSGSFFRHIPVRMAVVVGGMGDLLWEVLR